jgi:iron complex outermembrane receptor protein
MRTGGRARSRVFDVLLMGALAVQATLPAFAVQVHRFDVPVEDAPAAIRDFASQAQVQILVAGENIRDKQLHAVSGEYSIERGLQLLLADSGLRQQYVNDRSIAIVPVTMSAGLTGDAPQEPATAPADVAAADAVRGNRNSGARLHLAQAQTGNPSEPSSVEAGKRGTVEAKPVDLEEVVVTGTHIRGATNTASSVGIYTRDDIDATGATTIQQFLQTLPQNFNGGASEYTIGNVAGGGQADNAVGGSSPNLRGLGNNATLVLIDGHRVAAANTEGNFVDVSMIPLTAIERIEVVADGASAIYGSDAVGGVVNIILRHQFDGVESRVQYGTLQSGSHTVQVGQTAGQGWDGGSGVITYQYLDQTALSAGDRSYTASLVAPYSFTLVPEQIEHSVFAALQQRLATGIDLHGDLTYSHRSTNQIFSDLSYYSEPTPAVLDGYGASLGATVDLPRKSQLAVTATYSESDTHEQVFELPSALPLIRDYATKSSIISIDANLDGALISLPGGAVHYAIGGQYRQETFGHANRLDYTNAFYPRRHVEAGYVELHVPLLGPGAGSHGDPVLELTAADRQERYSDFGSTNNPQLGLILKPASGVKLRGTYGTSFTAPLLSQLNPVPFQITPTPVTDPTKGGNCDYVYPPGAYTGTCTNALFLFGGNPNLTPEKATTWTVGLDITPDLIKGFTGKLTYYNIVFKDQIGTVQGAISDIGNALIQETTLGPQIVQRNPSAATLAHWLSLPTYQNTYGVDESTISAIVDSRDLNLSTVTTRGLDFGAGYTHSLGDCQLETGIDGTYIFTFNNRFSAATPAVSIRNTVFNPVDLRLRARAMLTRGGFSTGLFLNYVAPYVNNGVFPNVPVASWTTADAVVSYQFAATSEALKGVTVAFNVSNLADKDPPFVQNVDLQGLTFDGANANPLGRSFSLRVSKRW